MIAEGFELQSCNSNCVEIQDRVVEDGTLSNHGTDCDKVLKSVHIIARLDPVKPAMGEGLKLG